MTSYRNVSPLFCVALAIVNCAAAATYAYDAAGRLIKVDNGAAGSIVYSYDKAGNLISRSVVSAGSSTITSVNTAGGGPSIAQNTWIEIKGANLVPATTPADGVIWNNAPEFASGRMPTVLNGVSVTVDGKPAYVYFYCSAATSTVCASDQINALTPLDNVTGQVSVIVTSGTSASTPFPVSLNAVAPSFLRFAGGNYVAATHADGVLLGPASLYPGASTPAQGGETVQIYGVGFGLPAASLTAGSSTQSGSLPTLPVCSIGGKAAALTFAGLISPGLYQLNLVVPSGVHGDNAISCAYAGSTTPAGDLISVLP